MRLLSPSGPRSFLILAFNGSLYTKKAALILNIQGRVEHLRSAMLGAAFYVLRKNGNLKIEGGQS
jgi:hypothetical protein